MTDETATVPTTTPGALARRLRSGEATTILDVRDRDEFDAWHVDGPGVDAVQIPHVKFVQAEVTDSVDDLAADLDEPVVVVCGEGDASAYVADLLLDAGVDASNLAGGMEGWARVYDAATVADGPVTVVQYQRPSSGCLSYLVHDGERALVVDPLRAFAERYVADCEAAGVDLAYAVDTHVHADHVSGVRALAALAGAETVLPAGATERGLAFDARFLADGDVLDVGDGVDAVALPGHTTEMTGLRVGDGLLAGDSLFLDGVARPDLETGADGAREMAATLYDTLHDRVLALPDDVRVAPGHVASHTPAADDDTYTATVGALRERVAALSLDRAAFVERVGTDLPERPANVERIIETNLGRDDPDDETAFELELGPNNCAAGSAD
jgi:glyoxylase-like metal-dependent hydrolase (beta-lactamase superfamily II)